MASDWLQIPGNEHPYKRLRDVVASGEAIAFVGAGASAGLYPLWPELIRRLADAAVRVDHKKEENLEYWLKAADPQDAVNQIRETLKGTYRDELRQIFAPRAGKDGNRFTPVHALLLRLPFSGFVTTNYDTALLEARQKLRPDLPFPAVSTWKDDYEVHRWRNGSIFKEPCPVLAAHGSSQRSDTIVLGTEDYREAYNTGAYASLFEHLWGACQLVLVGFGFSDPWLEFLAGQAITKVGAHLGAPRHCAIMGLRELNAISARQHSFRDKYNADPVFYHIGVGPDGSEDHSALLSILQALVADTGAGPSGAGGVTPKGGGRSTRKRAKPVPSPQHRSSVVTVEETAEQPASREASGINQAHRRRTTVALREAPELRDTLVAFLPSSNKLQREAALVEQFTNANPAKVKEYFFAVRRALREVLKDAPEQVVIRRAEIAAAYLYCLAAQRLVDRSKHHVRITELGVEPSVICSPHSSDVVCAIIVTALCGGKVSLLPNEKDEHMPRAEYVFRVRIPDGSDCLDVDVAREAYRAVFDGWRGETASILDSGSGNRLSQQAEDDLDVRIENIRSVDDANPAFVVEPAERTALEVVAGACSQFSRRYQQVPVVLLESEDVTGLLGMRATRLLAYVKEFWSDITVLRYPHSHSLQASEAAREKDFGGTSSGVQQ